MSYTNLFFGSGELYVFTPTTPIQVRKCSDLKNISIEIQAETIKAYGSKGYPIAVADGKRSISGKATIQTFQPDLMASVLNGTLTNSSAPVTVQTGTISSTTIAVSGGGATTIDFGLKIAGVPATRVASGPAAGEYSYSAPNFTVAAGDNGKAYELSTMTPNASTGYKLTGGNPTMGVSNTYKLVLAVTDAVTGQKGNLTMYAAKFLSSSLPFASEDFTGIDISWDAFADSSGNTFELSVAP